MLKNATIKGWPEKRDECPLKLRSFWNYRDELSILDGLVLKGTRIIIPEQCQEEVLEKLHEGHFGVDHTNCEQGTVFTGCISIETYKLS